MKRRLFIVIALVVQNSFAADVFDRYEPRTHHLLDRLEANATIGGYPIWNGEGKWRLIEIKRYDSTGTAKSVPMGRVTVIQTENKQFVAAMDVNANLAQGSASDWTDEPCKRDDLLFKASLGGAIKNINCVTINHLANYLQNPNGKLAEAFAEVSSQGVEIPPTVLLITATRYTDNLRRLQVKLALNPEIEGFERARESWGRNPWHKSQALKDPKKRAFIDGLGVWSMSFAKAMDHAFEKDLNAFASISSWRKHGSGVSSQTSVSISNEDKLTELKRLYDDGLITQQVYLEQQKTILNAQ